MVVPCVAGVTTAVLSILVWHRLALTAGYRGYFAMLIGVAIAYAMAAVGRTQRGPRLQLACLGLTAVTLAVGNYLVVNALVQQFAQQHAQTVPRFIGADMFFHAWDQLTYGKDILYLVVGLALAGLVPHRRPERPRRELKI